MRWMFVLLIVCLVCSPSNSFGQDAETPSVKSAKKSFSSRMEMQRMELIDRYGGSAESERAVAGALVWFARHQLADGGWSFDHRLAKSCAGKCARSGSAGTARNAATAMSLLCFLAAGQTHEDGRYQDVVANGLKYLTTHIKPAKKDGGSFHEAGGSMYSHGLATRALCEAYGMTGDMELMKPAQAAINFVHFSQDPVGGGWRYGPKQAGDTSVTGWQIAALKTAHRAFLKINPNTVRGAIKFLDDVSADDGAHYGYTTSGRGRATTAIGLLCRMQLGWDNDNPALHKGIEWLAEAGPSIGNGRASLYYNYYATQALFHFGDKKLWKKWNAVMRDGLVASQNQVKNSHEFGSWSFKGDDGAERGGRLYCTARSTLIVETYYRQTPLHLQGMQQ